MHNPCLSIGFFVLFSASASALQISVGGPKGMPLPAVMVTVISARNFDVDKSDNGYPKPGIRNQTLPELTRFTDEFGRIDWPEMPYQQDIRLRFRKPRFKDLLTDPTTDREIVITLEPETDTHALARQKPANTWFSALRFDDDDDLRKHFVLQCGFCHQQGSKYLRWTRTESEWQDTINRMIGYGSRLHDKAQERVPRLLIDGYSGLSETPEIIPDPRPWQENLAQAAISEWAIGNSFSQMHDLLLASSGMVYVGDNLQDRLYEINPEDGSYVVHKLPHAEGADLGGVLSARLQAFPNHQTYVGIHSFAEAGNDGHIFITSSAIQAIIEFDPVTKAFTTHNMDQGYYPHTVRVDHLDRVWFTLALSNQIAYLDRASGKFHFFDLDSRSVKESVTISSVGLVFKLLSWGVPLHLLPIDEKSSGLPLPYGIDVDRHGNAWFARLHTDAIGKVDGRSGEVTMYKTPFKGPRRLRADSAGNLWIAAFPEGKIVKFDPLTESFTAFDLPTQPLGSETPYSLNVDRERDVVWVNGTASDTLIRFDIKRQKWDVYPLPRQVTFTRDVEIAQDGSVYTTNSNFPAWHIEDGQPTLIHLRPGQ